MSFSHIGDMVTTLDRHGRGRESFLTISMSMILFLISGSPGLARLSALSLSLWSSLGPVIMIAAAPVIGQQLQSRLLIGRELQSRLLVGQYLMAL